MFTIPSEAVFNTHPAVYRSALVGVGPAEDQRPVLVVEPLAEHFPGTRAARAQLLADLRQIGQQHPHTAGIHDFLLRRALPVDIRHNAKIFREQLTPWAAARLGHDR